MTLKLRTMMMMTMTLMVLIGRAASSGTDSIHVAPKEVHELNSMRHFQFVSTDMSRQDSMRQSLVLLLESSRGSLRKTWI